MQSLRRLASSALRLVYMNKVIVITGTPGSGKTTIAKLLCKRIRGSRLIQVNQYIFEKKLFSSYDADGVRIVRMKKLAHLLNKEVLRSGGSVIIEGHVLCDMKIKDATVIVIREHLSRIKSRLVKRGYSVGKIRDNIVSEAIDYCGEHARRNYANVYEVLNGREVVERVLSLLKGGIQPVEIELLEELKRIVKDDAGYVI